MKKPYTIRVKNLDGWWSAVCLELRVSGFGETKKAALEAVARSMESKLLAQARCVKSDYRRIAQLEAA